MSTPTPTQGDPKFSALSGRHREILDAVICLFIESALPVGSRTVSKHLATGLSPATIRNAMADLEDVGLLAQPHTSAGRVPTPEALRFWIDEVVQPTPLAPAARERLEAALASSSDPKQQIERLVHTLSKLVCGVGIALAPRLDHGRLARAELVPVGSDRLLLLWVTQRGVVYHRVVVLERMPRADDIQVLERLLNEHYVGQTFEEVRRGLLNELLHLKQRFDDLIQRLLSVAPLSDDDVILDGVGRMAAQPEFEDVEVVRKLYAAFEDRHALAHVLERVAASGGLQVLLNEEAGLGSLTSVGVVAAPYGGASPLGTVGVVGPWRMPYPQVLSLVQYAAQLLSEALHTQDEAG